MPPVVTRSLQGCLAVVALLMSAWGSLRAAVERPFAETGDGLGPIVADARCLRTMPAQAVVIAAATAPEPSAAPCVSSAPRVLRTAAMVEAPALAAPSPRLGAANGPRAP